MAWTNSKVFMAWIEDVLENVTAMDTDNDTFKAALYDNSITPDQTVTSANTAYNAGVWAAGHVFDASGWPSVGRDLASVTSGRSSNVYTLDALDTASANSTTTLTNAFGTQVYDDTITTPVADQGIAYLYFGGSQSVTSGSFTIVWNGSGIVTFTG